MVLLLILLLSSATIPHTLSTPLTTITTITPHHHSIVTHTSTHHQPRNLTTTSPPLYSHTLGDDTKSPPAGGGERTTHPAVEESSSRIIYKRSLIPAEEEEGGGGGGTTTTTATTASTTNTTKGRERGPRRRRGRRRRRRRKKGKRRIEGEEQLPRGRRRIKDMSLWIDRNQVKMFSGYLMEIFVIHNGRILPYILDPNFEKQLPVIPAQVENVNFTWCSGGKKYHYSFDQLTTQAEELLQVPALSLPPHGTVPRKPQVFSVDMRCTGNISGIATFSIGLAIHTAQKTPLPGTPLRLTLRKECRHQGPDPECDLKCHHGGVCDESQQCQCAEGYMGQYCDAALCYPQCLNGGSCTTPGRCSCPPGFQGRHCEGGICENKCKNGGKCVQKDRCKCRRGFFGDMCQYSQCFVACINGGRCRGVNKCRCPAGFAGDHCEVALPQEEAATRAPKRCRRRCRHGDCLGASCTCHEGYTGRWCRRRVGRGGGRPRVWVR